MARLIRLFFKSGNVGSGSVDKETLYCRTYDGVKPDEDNLSFFFLPPYWNAQDLGNFGIHKRGLSAHIPWGVAYDIEVLRDCGFKNFRFDTSDLRDVYRNLHVVCDCPTQSSVQCLQESYLPHEIVQNIVIEFVPKAKLGINSGKLLEEWKSQPRFQEGYVAEATYQPKIPLELPGS
jgi:hypothetical protein